MNVDDLWSHLAKSGISKCSDELEIDQHDDIKTTKSYYFGCLSLADGSTFSDVLITLNHDGNCDIVFGRVESNFDPSDSGPNAAIEQLKSNLSAALKSFIKNKIDMV